MRRSSSRIVLSVGLQIVAFVVAPSPPAFAAPRPDLVVPSIVTSSNSVAAGLSFKVTEATRNVGAARAGRSGTGLYLSRDRTLSSEDERLSGRSVHRLAPRRTSKASTRLAVPASTPLGRYFVLACADDTERVSESRERNNCRAATTRVRVRAPTCVEDLRILDITFTPGPDTKGVADPVTVQPPIAGIDFIHGSETNAEILMDCTLARQVWKAADGMTALGIDAVEHFGSYSYRCIGGGTPPDCPQGLSQHAHATALDFGSFHDGATVYDVESDWVIDADWEETCSASTEGEKDAFLHSLICAWADQDIFNVLLTPNYNADHRDHFHVDLTPDIDFIE